MPEQLLAQLEQLEEVVNIKHVSEKGRLFIGNNTKSA
jgi:hypothetical protein